MSELATYQTAFAPRDGEPLFPELWPTDGSLVFAGNSGLGPSGQTLRDWSGRGNHGTLTNGPTWGPVGGRQALQFDGVDDKITLVTPQPAQTGTVFMMAMFLSLPAGGYTALAEPTRNASGNAPWSLNLNATGNTFRGYIGNASTINAVVGSVLSTRIEYSFAMTWDGAFVRAYVNGAEIGSTPQTVSPHLLSSGTTIFANNTGDGFSVGYVNGVLREMRIYTSALNSSQIRLLATCPGIAYEMAPARYAGETPSSYRRRLQAAQIASCGVIG